MNDEPTQPTMREQIEGLIADLTGEVAYSREKERECDNAKQFFNATHHQSIAIAYEGVINSLRAILGETSAEKGTTARV